MLITLNSIIKYYNPGGIEPLHHWFRHPWVSLIACSLRARWWWGFIGSCERCLGPACSDKAGRGSSERAGSWMPSDENHGVLERLETKVRVDWEEKRLTGLYFLLMDGTCRVPGISLPGASEGSGECFWWKMKYYTKYLLYIVRKIRTVS